MIKIPRLGTTAAFFLVLVGTVGPLAVGCERKTKTEEAVEEVQDEIEDAAEKAKDKVNEAKEEVEDEIDDAN